MMEKDYYSAHTYCVYFQFHVNHYTAKKSYEIDKSTPDKIWLSISVQVSKALEVLNGI